MIKENKIPSCSLHFGKGPVSEKGLWQTQPLPPYFGDRPS